jgi:hypothetical protein
MDQPNVSGCKQPIEAAMRVQPRFGFPSRTEGGQLSTQELQELVVTISFGSSRRSTSNSTE